jgi:hypothetical protein
MKNASAITILMCVTAIEDSKSLIAKMVRRGNNGKTHIAHMLAITWQEGDMREAPDICLEQVFAINVLLTASSEQCVPNSNAPVAFTFIFVDQTGQLNESLMATKDSDSP